MKTKENKPSEPKKSSNSKILKSLSKDQLETIVGGPITSRGTETSVQH